MENEIQQLEQFLANPIDRLWLLGFFSQVHPKFVEIIGATIDDYVRAATTTEGNEAAFKATSLLDQVWLKFHYPIINYYKYGMTQIFRTCQSQFAQLKLYKPRAVEARKLHADFKKFVRAVNQFYCDLMEMVMANYSIPLIPSRVCKRVLGEHFVRKTGNDELESVQLNLAFLVHRVLLAIADLQRHLVSADQQYIKPCLGYKEWRTYREVSGVEKLARLINEYGESLDGYHDCLAVMPTIAEPYNHIGMIYNLVDDKFTALYWFVRSQMTRLAGLLIGHQNLLALINKGWFIHRFDKRNVLELRANTPASIADVNNCLGLLCGFYQLPQVYAKSGALHAVQFTNGIPYAKMEAAFIRAISNDFWYLATKQPQAFVHHLVVIMGFCDFLALTRNQSKTKSMYRFAFRYIDTFLGLVETVGVSAPPSVLVALRLILAWLKENTVAFMTFHEREGSVIALAKAINRLTPESRPQEAPTRAYYFTEDVDFKDFSAIGYRFKDFDDEALFTDYVAMSGDWNCLVDKSGVQFPPGVTLVEEYEHKLRTEAIIVMGDRILNLNSMGVEIVDNAYVVNRNKRVKAETKIVRKKKQTAPKAGSYSAAVAMKPQIVPGVAPDLSVLASEGPPVAPLESLEEIQNKMKTHIQDTISQEKVHVEVAESNALELMVNSLVGDVTKMGVSSEKHEQPPASGGVSQPLLMQSNPTNPYPQYVGGYGGPQPSIWAPPQFLNQPYYSQYQQPPGPPPVFMMYPPEGDNWRQFGPPTQ